MLHSPDSSISNKLMNNAIQPSTNDCGVYTIAFAVSQTLAFGKEPAYLHYDYSKMRSHLLKYLQSGVLIVFPSKPEPRKVFILRITLSHYTALAECQRVS